MLIWAMTLNDGPPFLWPWLGTLCHLDFFARRTQRAIAVLPDKNANQTWEERRVTGHRSNRTCFAYARHHSTRQDYLLIAVIIVSTPVTTLSLGLRSLASSHKTGQQP